MQPCAADFLISAAVAEFKGPDIFGVVRFAQVNVELARIEANFSGLSAGKHGWSINEFGDLTRGAASTSNIFNPEIKGIVDKVSFQICSQTTLTHMKFLLDYHIITIYFSQNMQTWELSLLCIG